MFGISTLGWVHTLGSLPAIPLAIYMFARYGKIMPRSWSGLFYLITMLIGSITVFFISDLPASLGIGGLTTFLLIAGYAIGYTSALGRVGIYLETIFLSITTFLIMLPTVTETLTRVPDGNPIVKELNSPILLGAQGSLLILLIAGLTAQILYLRKQGKRMATISNVNM